MNIDSSPSAQGKINKTAPFILFGAFLSTCFFYAAIIASGLLDELISTESSTDGAREIPLPLPIFIAGLSFFNITAALVIGFVIRPLEKTTALALYRTTLQKLILQCACFEAIAIYGFVGHILGMESIPSLLVVGFALLCFVTLIPGLRNQMDRLSLFISQSEGREV